MRHERDAERQNGPFKIRFAVTSIVGEPHHDILGKGKWKAVQNECGHRLSKDVRNQLQGACNRFLLCAHAEKQGAPPLADALTWIDEIRRTAQEFAQARKNKICGGVRIHILTSGLCIRRSVFYSACINGLAEPCCIMLPLPEA